MNEETKEKIQDLLNQIPINEWNIEAVEEVKEYIANKNYIEALKKLEEIVNQREENEKEILNAPKVKEKKDEMVGIYPKKLSNKELEREYIGLLLLDPKLIVKFYFLRENFYFEDDELENIYKSILFTEGGAYSSEAAKKGYNFAKDTEKSFKLKSELKNEMRNKNCNMEKVYVELSKLFVLRKNYLAIPIQNIQDKVVEIIDYDLYDKMSVEEVEAAVIQVNDTEKFKRSILNQDLTEFLKKGDNNLRNGLPLPFPTLTNVFKGIRKGETMAYAMPSNAGKSRFTTDLAAHTALVHKKKVLVISNEMSEEKMKLCLITTIINNKAIQELHGHTISKTEGELLEFKFRPDNKNNVEVDEMDLS